MTNRQRRGAGESASSVPDFEPVKLRYRHDGLTPARQVAVVQAMAACGCIREACARVGISADDILGPANASVLPPWPVGTLGLFTPREQESSKPPPAPEQHPQGCSAPPPATRPRPGRRSSPR